MIAILAKPAVTGAAVQVVSLCIYSLILATGDSLERGISPPVRALRKIATG